MTAATGQRYLFAGGGTGGHISPGLAVIERLRELEPDCHITFICSQRPIDTQMLSAAGVEHTPIPARPFGLRPRPLLGFLSSWRHSVKQVSRLLHTHRPTAVLLLGGFVAAPVARTAARLKIPVIMLNLDAVPGKANRLMRRWATATVSVVPTPHDAWMIRHATRLPFPIRRIAQAPGTAPSDMPACRSKLGLDPRMPTLLVTGASQGAGSINDLMIALAAQHYELFSGWQVLHLSGRHRDAEVRTAYQAAGVPAIVLPFVEQMGFAWGAAELCISRAGANSVAEALVNAVPSLFLPYPYHRDEHQRANVESMMPPDAAKVVTDLIDPTANLDAHLPLLRELLTDAALRRRMRDRMLEQPMPDGALAIARLMQTAGHESASP